MIAWVVPVPDTTELAEDCFDDFAGDFEPLVMRAVSKAIES